MEDLHLQFNALLEKLSLAPEALLPVPIKAPFSLTFSIAGKEPVYLGDHRDPNGAYIENAVSRIMELCKALPCPPDLLRIQDPEEILSEPSVLKRLHLPDPLQVIRSSGSSILYWKLSRDPESLRPLFREVVRCELSPRGLEGLWGSVCLGDSRKGLLFQLIDDRSACLAAPEQPLLTPILRDFSHLIPEK